MHALSSTLKVFSTAMVVAAGLFPLSAQCDSSTATAISNPVNLPQSITTQGKHFIDERGAKVIFRGYNIQTKAPPFQPITSAADLDPLRDMGANLIRFNFIWEAAEPELGVYDQSYFDYYDRVIQWAWERGMYVLIDFHNNAYSRFAAKGCGSGFPAWTLSPDVTPAAPKPMGDCVFSGAMMQAMLSKPNYTLWHDFMTDKYGMRARFFELTRVLAEKYAKHPAVIGFDLNEPMVFKPGLKYDSETANQFFNTWHQYIQSINPRYITFWGDSPFQFIFVNQPPHLDMPSSGNVSFDAHFYEPGASGFGIPLFGTSASVNAIARTRDKYNIPVLVGEFGANLKGRNNQYFQYQMDRILHQFDKEMLSSTRWNYTPHWNPVDRDHFHDEDYSCFDENKQVRLSCAPRASLQVLSGELIDIDIQHQGEAKFFVPLIPSLSDRHQYADTRIELRWQHDPAQGSTKIFASRETVFKHAEVQIEAEGDGLNCRYDDEQRYILCSSDKAGEKHVVVHAR